MPHLQWSWPIDLIPVDPVINTKKLSMEDALSYTDYILTAICGHQLFKSTAFHFVQAWSCLLWMDKVSTHSDM